MIKRTGYLGLGFLVLALPLGAAGFDVYHSPADDGVNPGAAATIAIGAGSKTLHVYVDNGTTATPSDPCAGTGVGDEVCMWDLHVVCDPNITVLGFTPDPGAAAVFNQQASFVRMNGGEPLAGTLGPQKVGDLEVSASGTGDCTISGEGWVGTDLAFNPLGASVLGSACNDSDLDDLCNPVDACQFFALGSGGDPADLNGDGIPNECQCGDTNGDGFLTSTDAFAIVACGANPACAQGPPILDLWDTDSSGFLTSTDAFNAVATGAAGTEYLNTCNRRPEGTPAP